MTADVDLAVFPQYISPAVGTLLLTLYRAFQFSIFVATTVFGVSYCLNPQQHAPAVALTKQLQQARCLVQNHVAVHDPC